MQCHLFMSWKKVLLGGFFPKRDTQLCYPPTVLPSPSSVGGSRANYSYNRVTVSQNAAGNSETATISDHNGPPCNPVSHNIICYSPLSLSVIGVWRWRRSLSRSDPFTGHQSAGGWGTIRLEEFEMHLVKTIEQIVFARPITFYPIIQCFGVTQLLSSNSQCGEKCHLGPSFYPICTELIKEVCHGLE